VTADHQDTSAGGLRRGGRDWRFSGQGERSIRHAEFVRRQLLQDRQL
jgi:hypothetical protein